MHVRLLGIAVVLTVLLLTGCSDSSSRSTPAQPPKPDRIDLIRYGQTVVTQVLKSPSSADFPSWGYKDDAYDVSEFGKDAYMIKGWVEAQNAFGATLREKWTVVRGGPQILDSRLRWAGPAI